jgi:hypothetical protein
LSASRKQILTCGFRRGSSVADEGRIETAKSFKLEDGTSAQRKGSSTSQPDAAVQITVLANTSGLYPSAGPTTSNEQWKGLGLDWYVHNPRQPPQDSLPQDPNCVWTSFPPSNTLNSVSSPYIEGNTHPPGDNYPSNTGGLAQEDYPFPFDPEISFPWTDANDRLEGTGATPPEYSPMHPPD